MVALFIYIYTLVASRSEFYTSILCEVIKIRKKLSFSYFSPDVVAFAVDEKICCAAVHIFTYYMTDLWKAVHDLFDSKKNSTYTDDTRSRNAFQSILCKIRILYLSYGCQ